MANTHAHTTHTSIQQHTCILQMNTPPPPKNTHMHTHTNYKYPHKHTHTHIYKCTDTCNTTSPQTLSPHTHTVPPALRTLLFRCCV